MINLLMVILDDTSFMPALLQAWEAAGVPGATILESAGAYRSRTWFSQWGLGAIDHLFRDKEVRRHTLIVAIEADDLLDRAIGEAERVVGGFDRPGSGLLLVLPVGQVRGLHKVQPQPAQVTLPEASPPSWFVNRDTCVSVVDATLSLDPTIVRSDTPLDEVVQAMLAHPGVHVVCVVNDQGRLVGVLDLPALADDLFFHIMPEEFLSHVTDLDEAMHFAQMAGVRTAADAMREPVWVKRGETVKEAFKRMHKHKLQGLPVVDDLYHVIGYINLLELAAVCLVQRADNSEAAP
ncbi:MAG: CBS domain-containing protein [Anaerolineae bacterium]|nr:CBS domain-containing protein [Anaerolineae bacterium]